MSGLDQQEQIDLLAWLEDTGMPDDFISRIMELAEAMMQAMPRPSEEDAMASLYFSESNLRRLWGASFDSRIRAACRMLEEVDQRKPGFIEFIHAHPQIFNNPAIAGRIALHAERRYSN